METLKRRLLTACMVGIGIAGLSATAAEAGGWHHGGHHGGWGHGGWGRHHRGFGFGFAPTFVFGSTEREYVREYVPAPAPAPVYQPVPVYYPAPVYQQPAAPVYQQPVSAQPASVEFDQSYCREYENTAKIDGKIVKTYGTACRQADGTWKLVN